MFFLSPTPTVLPGSVVQIVNTQTGAMSTATTVIPLDDTIPQNTEGTEFMTLAITPTRITNMLKIDVVCNIATNGTNFFPIVALFQDTIASALAAQTHNGEATGSDMPFFFTYYMAAGTISPTTFKVRAGPNGAGTITFGGRLGGRLFGGVFMSSITITEIQV